MHTTFLHLWKILWDEVQKTVPTCPARVPSIFMGDSRFHHGSRGQCFLGSSSGCLASRQGTTPFVYRPCRHSRRTCRLASASLLSSPNSAASIRCRGTGTATSEPTPTELRHGNDSNQLSSVSKRRLFSPSALRLCRNRELPSEACNHVQPLQVRFVVLYWIRGMGHRRRRLLVAALR